MHVLSTNEKKKRKSVYNTAWNRHNGLGEFRLDVLYAQKKN